MIKEPCVDECWGCSRQRVGPWPGPAVCVSYAHPGAQWEYGRKCLLASHLLRKEEKKEKFMDPLKRSRRSMKAKK